MTSSTDEPRVWLDSKQAAEYVGCSIKTIRYALEAGELRGAQITAKGRWRIRRTWVDEWLDRKAAA